MKSNRVWSMPHVRLDTSRDGSVYTRYLLFLVGFTGEWAVQRAGFLVGAFLVVFGAALISQEPVISRGAPMTLTGEIVDIACYKQKGVAAGTGTAHVDCAKMCVLKKGASLGILSDGDGLYRLWGPMAQDKYAKLTPYVGQTVELTGNEVVLSNNYDVRSFEVKTVKATKK